MPGDGQSEGQGEQEFEKQYLTQDTAGRSIDQDTVLVNHVDDSGDLALVKVNYPQETIKSSSGIT